MTVSERGGREREKERERERKRNKEGERERGKEDSRHAEWSFLSTL